MRYNDWQQSQEKSITLSPTAFDTDACYRKGPFPGVLLISGSGANDKNGTLGFVHKNGPKPLTPLWQIAQFLTERGFAVLRYDKRCIGANFTINQNVWGNATINDLIHDANPRLERFPQLKLV